jgi:beta-glucosidase
MGAKHSKKVSEPPARRASGPAPAVLESYAEDSEGISTRNTNDTPNTEVSPPESPSSKSATLIDPNDKRANARTLAASLSLEEQVSIVPIDH